MFNKLFKSNDPYQHFWKWFTKHSADYEQLEKNQNVLFNNLSTQLKKLDSALTFEFSIMKDNKREFVISCDGRKASIPAVVRLVECAPKLPTWKITAFRQKNTFSEMSWEKLTLKKSDVVFSYSFNQNGLTDIVLYMKGFDDKERNAFGSVGFLMLDHLLGEYDVMTKIGAITFKSFNDIKNDQIHEISKLESIISSHFAKL